MNNKILKLIGFVILIQIILMLPFIISINIYNFFIKSIIQNRTYYNIAAISAIFIMLFLLILLKKDKFKIRFPENKKNPIQITVIIISIVLIELLILILTKLKLHKITDIYVYTIAPIGEELIFRLIIFYFLYNYLVKIDFKKNIVFLTILISSCQFSLIHLFNIFTTELNINFILIQVLYSFLLGFIFGYLRYKANSIIIPIIVHMIINFLPVINYF